MKAMNIKSSFSNLEKDAAEAFEPAEESLDLVPFLVNCLVIQPGL
jgi:hypothetical protein